MEEAAVVVLGDSTIGRYRAVSTPNEQRAAGPGKAPEDARRAILDRARPLPPVEETMIDDLTDDEARIFLETILEA